MWFTELKKSNRCVVLSARRQAGAAQLEGLLGPCLGAAQPGAALTSLPGMIDPLPPSTLLLLLNQPDRELRVSWDSLQSCFLPFPSFLFGKCSSFWLWSLYRQKVKERACTHVCACVCVWCLVSFLSEDELKSSSTEQPLLKCRAQKWNQWDINKGWSQWECSPPSQHKNV